MNPPLSQDGDTMYLLIAADVALLAVLAVKGTGANLPLLGFLLMGNVLFLTSQRRSWRGFGIGGTIAVVAYLGSCCLFPGRVAAAYESLVVPLSTPFEETLFSGRVAGDYANGTVYGLAEGYSIAALVNLFESLLISLPMIAFSVSWAGIADVTTRRNRPSPPESGNDGHIKTSECNSQ